MKCNLHFFLLNEHFSQEHADLHNKGEESEMNRKFLWEDEFELRDVQDITVHDNSSYQLQGSTSEGGAFNYGVPKMKMFELLLQNRPSTFVGCSESIIASFTIQKANESLVLSIYLKDGEPFANPVTGIYIAAQEFPKELAY